MRTSWVVAKVRECLFVEVVHLQDVSKCQHKGSKSPNSVYSRASIFRCRNQRYFNRYHSYTRETGGVAPNAAPSTNDGLPRPAFARPPSFLLSALPPTTDVASGVQAPRLVCGLSGVAGRGLASVDGDTVVAPVSLVFRPSVSLDIAHMAKHRASKYGHVRAPTRQLPS